MSKYLFLACLVLSGCFQTYDPDNDADRRTVPVTNNPYVVPNHGGGMPMMGEKGPY